jgi:hypothetical protein
MVRQEMKSGQMAFINQNTITTDFASMFCPENEVMTGI